MNKPEGYFRYWGKADPKYKEEPKWHPLVYHCLDVAASANSIMVSKLEFTRSLPTRRPSRCDDGKKT